MKDLCFKYLSPENSLGDLILLESERQLKKWGIQDHSPFEWMAYITEEVGELAKAISEFEYRKGSREEISKEAIQVATLCLKLVEMYNYPYRSGALEQ